MPDGGITADVGGEQTQVVMALLTSPAGLGVGTIVPDALISRRDVVVRLAAALFFGSGVLTFVAAAIAPAGQPRAVMVGVGIASLLIGGFTWIAPWERWSSRASFCLAPAALVLIAVANVYGSPQPYDYAVFYVIVHAWVGLAHRPRSSLLLAPLTAVAYCEPLFTIADDLGTALATALVVVPACVLVGEGISWMMSRLESSEALGRRLSAALAREYRAVEQLRDAHAQLEFLAYHDAVTQLPNRAFFEQHLGVALAQARRSGESIVVGAIDLDKFKLVNDTLGHAAGDEFLCEVATRLHACLREGDVVARVGGDEFLLLLAGGPQAEDSPRIAEHVDEVAERIGANLNPPLEIGESELWISASMGFAVFPRDGVDPEALVKLADARMYRGKRERGPVILPETSRDGELAEASRLRASAAGGGWVLHYQSIVELIMGRTIGAEALVRWDDPVRGLRPPDEFLALVAELGLEPAMTEWVLGEVARTCAEWHRMGVVDDLTMITLNMSPRQLWHPRLTDSLGAIVEHLGRPNLLVLEVTESALAMDPSRARDVLMSLRARGVRIALDDFGTGYSSLARMRELPIDILKIDGSFIRDIHRDDMSRQIVRSVIRLANGLEMVPIAEGVESASQLEVLMEEGCSLAQGFLFDRPVPRREFEAALATSGPVTI
jgi:diguanylate cyclase (GGDEF)-like protein